MVIKSIQDKAMNPFESVDLHLRDSLNKETHEEDKILVIKFGSKFYFIDHKNIAYIYNKESVSVLVHSMGIQIPVYKNLQELISELNCEQFMYFKRSLIANRKYIKQVIRKTKSTFQITMLPDLGLRFEIGVRTKLSLIEMNKFFAQNV